MSDVLRRLIRYGLDPLQAIRCATINSAIRLRRDDLGMVAAGRRADLAVLADLHEIVVEPSMSAAGAWRQRAHARGDKARRGATAGGTMKLRPSALTIFGCGSGRHDGRAPVRTIKGARFNSWSEIEVEVRDGFAVVPNNVSVMTVAHRHGRSNLAPQIAIIEGWDRWRGAYASSYSHDSHNLVAYGYHAEEMALAANSVIEMGGGIAVVKDGRVTASIAYPVAGMLSDKEPAEVAGDHGAWSRPRATSAPGSRPIARSRRSRARASPAIPARTSPTRA